MGNDSSRPDTSKAFDQLKILGPGCWIDREELRGVTLHQLEILWQYIESHCVANKWRRESLNGDGSKLSVRLQPQTVNMHDVLELVIKPATSKSKSSLVELFAFGQQPPTWFVSHWWGEPVHDFIACVRQHARDHRLSENTAYWVWACAMRPHAKAAEPNLLKPGPPGGLALARAISLCDGILLVVDGRANAFRRAWCCYEIYESIRQNKSNKPHFCMYTFLRNGDPGCSAEQSSYGEFGEAGRSGAARGGEAVGLTEGKAPIDEDEDAVEFAKQTREAAFPFPLAEAALELTVEKSQAAFEHDRVHILSALLDAQRDGLIQSLPEKLAKLDQVNGMLRARFAAMALRKAFESGKTLLFLEFLAQGAMRQLSLDFRRVHVKRPELVRFFWCLPSGLRTLVVSGLSEAQILCDGREATPGEMSIGDAGAQALAMALERNPTLATLTLSSNRIGVSGAVELARALKHNGSVTALDVDDNNFGDGGVKALSKALKHNRKLASLILDRNGVGDEGAQALAKVLKRNDALTLLFLEENSSGDAVAASARSMGDSGAEALARGLEQNATLTTLSLKHNRVGCAGAYALAKALEHNEWLAMLSLYGNSVGADGAIALALALEHNKALTSLDLHLNNIGDEGAKALGAALKDKNNVLRSLSIDKNGIGDSGAHALALALKHNPTLTSLNLDFNRIGDAGAEALARALKHNEALSSLYLWSNNFGDPGARALAKALKHNYTLTSLYLYHNSITDSGTQALAKALRRNHTLTSLDLESRSALNDDIVAIYNALQRNRITLEEESF